MKFSIITPTFNKRPASLARVIDCVQRQSFQDFEHIICYEEDRYVHYDPPKTTHIVVKNCTEFGNRQRQVGIEAATGDYILMLDDDNILFQDALETIDSLSQDFPTIVYSPVFHRNDRELGTDDFRHGGIDLLQWCIRTHNAKSFVFPLNGYAADWKFFSLISTLNPRIVKNNKMIGVHWFPEDIDRVKDIPGWFNCRELYQYVVNKLPKNPICAEVGVHLGRSAISLAKDLKKKRLGGKLFAIDLWVRKSEKYQVPNSDFMYDQFLSWSKKFNTDDIIQPIKASSLQAAATFSDEYFDFVFLDAGHNYKDVADDIRAWLPKVKKGGILAGDDYHTDWPGVIWAVDEAFGFRTKHIGRGWIVDV